MFMRKRFTLMIFALLSVFYTVIGQTAGTTYAYNLADGSEMTQDTQIKYSTFSTGDGFVTINSNAGQQFWWHDATHGVVVYNNNTFEFEVAGNAIITFITCTYSADGAVFNFTDSEGTSLGSCAAENYNGDDAFPINFSYTGGAGTVTATLVTGGSVYIHGVSVDNAATVEPSNGKIDVWDFGADSLSADIYNNQLTVDTINNWYSASIVVGSSGNVLPSFTAGALSWVGGSNDRLRTSNTNLTRYDENLGGVSEYTGRIYVNSAAATSRYLSFTLSEDDEVTIYAISQSGGGQFHFEYVADPASQNDVVAVPTDLTELNFVAKAAGTYRVYDSQDKPSYYRIYRKDAVYGTISGSINESAAGGIPAGYGIVFTNAAGKSWTAVVSSATYTVDLPVGYTYDLSLSDANGYVISSGTSYEVTGDATNDMVVEQVTLNTLSGNVTGLGTELVNLELIIEPTDPSKVYIPTVDLDNSTGAYSVQLEPDVEYVITANGVNDFEVDNDTVTITGDQTSDIVFVSKPTYDITITTLNRTTGEALTAEQLSALSLTFTNLNEEGYVYDFASVDNIKLRDGTYTIAYDGLDDYAVEMALASNLVVSGDNTSKELLFDNVTQWTFDDKAITGSKYKGLVFTGNVGSEVNKGHLTAKDGATIKVPVSPGDGITISYYYSADFTIGGVQYTTSSSSTSLIEYASYTYTGDKDSTVTITVGASASTTYITNIGYGIVEFSDVIYVGEDKEFHTINEALRAISIMDRPDKERVTVMIDPGNYEEMLVIDQENVSFVNAAATPNINIINKGVDIADGAVRITSYYGHGYNYCSMGDNQKWNAELLRVNKENGYPSADNAGAGTTNGSYWNATVVVSAKGFEADHIIFENSFNQYISQKESEDLLVMWDSGSKGERPVDYGNTSVQSRSFVERAAAIAIIGSADKVILNKCRVVGRQDSFFGGGPARVVIYKGAMMGAVDYIFGAMVATFYKTELVMNTSDDASDQSYLTAAQQSSGRGYLMYECIVTSPEPNVETASTNGSKPGYFGRPWQANTSEVVFYNTTVEASTYPGSENKSLIVPDGWSSSLGGESTKMYEYGTIEESGEDNSGSRAPWSTVLAEPTLTDGTAITTFNFTKGNDNWDPIPTLIANDPETGFYTPKSEASVQMYVNSGKLYIQNVTSRTQVNIYSINGALVSSFETSSDNTFTINKGLWIVKVITGEGSKAIKVLAK